MDYHSNIAIGALVPGMPQPLHKAAILQDGPSDNPGKLDGSIAAMSHFLEEMAGLVDAGGPSEAPILTLQFDEIVTVTSLSVTEDLPCLSITALLPRREQPISLALAQERPVAAAEGEENQVLWDAGEGRYVLARKIPIAHFADERSVLDAILDAADAAKSWLASVNVRTRPSL